MEIYIRDATSDDAGFIGWAILTAARGNLTKPSVWDLAFPVPEDEKLRLLSALTIAEPACAAHFSGFVIAENEAGEPLSAACGFIPKEKPPEAFTEALLGVVEQAGWDQSQQMELMSSFNVFAKCLPMSNEEVWVLEYIATKPEARGTGATFELLEDLLECGRDYEIAEANVAYFAGNAAAKKIYRKLGFKESHELLDKEFEEQFGVSGVMHMKLAL